MPLHDSGGLDEDEGSAPTWPNAAQPDPEEPVTIREPRLSGRPLEHHQLMPERNVLTGVTVGLVVVAAIPQINLDGVVVERDMRLIVGVAVLMIAVGLLADG